MDIKPIYCCPIGTGINICPYFAGYYLTWLEEAKFEKTSVKCELIRLCAAVSFIKYFKLQTESYHADKHEPRNHIYERTADSL